MKGFTFGSDPEVMLFDRATKAPVSAIRFLDMYGKETKKHIGDGQFMFYDNVLMEFNINPSDSYREFQSNVLKALNAAQELLGNQIEIRFQASAEFPASERKDPRASIFGCDPEYNIYKRNKQNQIMRVEPPASAGALRTCGGHIHIGHPIASTEGGNPPLVVKLMDGFVGTVATILNTDKTAAKRREMYGGAGTHRITGYGLEYRTLSNFWLKSPNFIEIIFKLTRQVIELAMTNPTVLDKFVSPTELETIVNQGKTSDAKILLSQLKPFMACELFEDIHNRMGMNYEKYDWKSLWDVSTKKMLVSGMAELV